MRTLRPLWPALSALPGNHRLRIMTETCQGHAPCGQFYEDEIGYNSPGLYLGS